MVPKDDLCPYPHQQHKVEKQEVTKRDKLFQHIHVYRNELCHNLFLGCRSEKKVLGNNKLITN